MSYSTSKPINLGFIFDIIIVRIDLSKIKIDETSQLTVDVKFNKNDIRITSSRINVDEFKSGRSYEFTENPSVLKDQLFMNPLACKVSYDSKLVGHCDFIWPDNFLNCITECAGELTHCDEVDIKNEDEIVGKMEIIIRLQIKCQEFDEKFVAEPINNSHHQTGNVIDPNDILFVVGEDKITSNTCGCSQVGIIPATDSIESINPTCLDLSNFRTVNGRTVPNTDILNSIDTGCCKLKKPVNEYQQMIESLLGKGKEPSCQAQQKESCKLQCQKPTKPVDCVSDTKFSSCSSSSDSYNPCRCISNESANECEILISQKDCNAEKLTKRYCPLCRENITWLPKFSACPKCGFKSINYPEEKLYNDQLTADEILQEYLDKKVRDITDQSGDSTLVLPQYYGQCRCTCSKGKICAYCRIKKSCEHIFKLSAKDNNDCEKCDIKSSDIYNVCKTSMDDCRPYLVKVFQELRDHYNIRETKKNSDESKDFNPDLLDCNCNNSFQSKQPNELRQEKTSRHRRKEVLLANERKNFLEKNFRKQESPCKGKIFVNSAERKNPNTKIGHKTCLNGYAGRKNVPRNMGWLWNADTTGIRSGWIPGAIRKPIKVLMKHFLDHKFNDSSNKQQEQDPCCDPKPNEKEGVSKYDELEEDCTNKPTLHICKKNGVYYITLRPLKDAETLQECSDPYVDMNPIQFKIIKNPVLTEIRNLKQSLKAMGFQKCTCHKPISQCCCRTYLEKMNLEYQCQKECCMRSLQSCRDSLILSDTSDSEAEFDFGVTPPAGVPRADRCINKKQKVSSGTQCVENDWNVPPEYPKKLSKNLKLYNCAVGQRFGKAFSPYGDRGYTVGAAPVKGIYGRCGFIKGTEGKRSPGSFGGKGGRTVMSPKAYLGPDGKFNMANYLKIKAFNKPSPAELAEKKKQKLALLKGANPPLLCMVDRRGKPFNPCPPCFPISCDHACARDNRIC